MSAKKNRREGKIGRRGGGGGEGEEKEEKERQTRQDAKTIGKPTFSGNPKENILGRRNYPVNNSVPIPADFLFGVPTSVVLIFMLNIQA